MEQIPAQTNIPTKHSPILCGLANFFIFGSAYLNLRLYKRFFVFYGIMIVAIIIPISLVSLLVLLAAAIDSYLQAKAINEGRVQAEPFHKMKLIGGIALIITMSVIAPLVLAILASK